MCYINKKYMQECIGLPGRAGGQIFRFPFLNLLCFKETDDGVGNRKYK